MLNESFCGIGGSESVAGGARFDDGAAVGQSVDDGGAGSGVGEGVGPAGGGLLEAMATLFFS